MADNKQQQAGSSEAKKNKREEIKKVYSELKKIVPALQKDEFADSETIVWETAKYVGHLRWKEAKAMRGYRALHEHTEFLKAVITEVSQRIALENSPDSGSKRK